MQRLHGLRLALRGPRRCKPSPTPAPRSRAFRRQAGGAAVPSGGRGLE